MTSGQNSNHRLETTIYIPSALDAESEIYKAVSVLSVCHTQALQELHSNYRYHCKSTGEVLRFGFPISFPYSMRKAPC